MRVGFVGLGAIGKPMALRLAGAHDLVVHDLVAEPVAELERAGARTSASVALLADEVDVLCIMVRDDDQVRAVLDEALPALRPDAVALIYSTVAPATPAELERRAAQYGVLLADAPVSGGVLAAAEGTLAIMVGGSSAAYDAGHDVLHTLGALVVHAGPVGSGTAMKLARNLVHFTSFAGVGEAQRLAEAAGLSLLDLGRVVRHTDAITGGPGAIIQRETAGPLAAGDPWRPIFEHVAALGEKDLGFAVELASELGVDVPLAGLARQRLASGLGLEES